MGDMYVLKIILYLIGFCSLLFLAYATAKYMGGKQSRAMRGRNISIEETVALGGDKRLYLVRAGKQRMLIATTSKSVTFLTTVELEETPEEQESEVKKREGCFDFKTVFEKYTGIYKNKKEGNPPAREGGKAGSGEKTGGFGTNLGRLRSLVNNNTYRGKENEVDTTNEK